MGAQGKHVHPLSLLSFINFILRLPTLSSSINSITTIKNPHPTDYSPSNEENNKIFSKQIGFYKEILHHILLLYSSHNKNSMEIMIYGGCENMDPL